MNDIPLSALARAARLAALPVGYAGRAAWGIGRRVGGKPAEVVAAQVQARTAAQLFATLGELKGGAMKFGQALSIFEAALPEELMGPYRAALTKLQDSAPAMPPGLVHEVLAEQIGVRWRHKFAEFDDTAAAAASIGQVHHAVWGDGREVAVKIQYPGAGKALLSDLNQLSRVARVATSWIPGIEIAPILEELRARMGEELDYELEAANQQAFATAYDGDAHVLVPHVVLGRERVVVGDWISGRPLSAIIADGTQAERDAAGLRYMEFLLSGPSRCGLLHADPHPGNFRMLPDGRIGVLDFGAVKRLPEGLPPQLGRLLTLAIDGDSTQTLAGLRAEGFVREGIDIDADRLLEYLEPFIAPLRHSDFHFTRAWLQDVFEHIKDPRRPNYSVALRLNLPAEYFLIHRVWLGGIGVLCQLGARVPGRAVVGALIPGADLPPLAEPPRAEPPLAEPPLAEPPRAEPPRAEPPLAEPPRLKQPRRAPATPITASSPTVRKARRPGS
ncbi:MAG: AarF/UbiB family protein [Dermatophilaceae bacterium]